MPVRETLASRLTTDVCGTQVWDGLTGTCQTMPTEDWDAVQAAMNQLLLLIGERCDWKRLLLEAHQRCLMLDHRCLAEDHDDQHAYGHPCGESVHAAFARGGKSGSWQNWENDPGPQEPDWVDVDWGPHPWASTVHRVYRARQAKGRR